MSRSCPSMIVKKTTILFSVRENPRRPPPVGRGSGTSLGAPSQQSPADGANAEVPSPSERGAEHGAKPFSQGDASDASNVESERANVGGDASESRPRLSARPREANTLFRTPTRAFQSVAGVISPPAPRQQAASVTSTTSEAAKLGRTQPPSHWVNIFTIEAGFDGKEMKKQRVWAEECVSREVTYVVNHGSGLFKTFFWHRVSPHSVGNRGVAFCCIHLDLQSQHRHWRIELGRGWGG